MVVEKGAGRPVRVGEGLRHALRHGVGVQDHGTVRLLQQRIIVPQPSTRRGFVGNTARDEDRTFVGVVRGQHTDAVDLAPG